MSGSGLGKLSWLQRAEYIEQSFEEDVRAGLWFRFASGLVVTSPAPPLMRRRLVATAIVPAGKGRGRGWG